MTAAAPHRISMPAHVLRASDLDEDQLADVLRSSARMKQDPYGWTNALPGRTLVTLFEKPSTRTRVSFAAAAQRLGMLPLVLRGDELQLGRGETIEDTARVLSGYCSAIAVRTFEQSKLEQLAGAATVPVINALSDDHHPCQALADLLTLREHFGRMEGLKVAYVGDPTNVAHSLLEAAPARECTLRSRRPRDTGRTPMSWRSRVALRWSMAAGHDHRRSLHAVADAHAVYTDVWVSRETRPSATRAFGTCVRYQVDVRLMSVARRMPCSCTACRRTVGEEVTAEVIDGTQSLVLSRRPTACRPRRRCCTRSFAPRSARCGSSPPSEATPSCAAANPWTADAAPQRRRGGRRARPTRSRARAGDHAWQRPSDRAARAALDLHDATGPRPSMSLVPRPRA